MGENPDRAAPAHGSVAAQGSTHERYTSAVNALNEVVSTGDLAALPRIIEALRSVAAEFGEGDPGRPGALNNLGSALQLEHERGGDREHLAAALTHYRSAVTTAREDDPDAVLYLCNLSLALGKHANATDAQDGSRPRSGTDSRASATEAVRAAREAVRRTNAHDQRRVTALARLGNALQLHAAIAGGNDDEESIRPLREAVRIAGGAERATLQIDLASAQLRHYERGGPPEILDEALGHLQESAEGLGGRQRVPAVQKLAEALRLRFHQHGDLTDLRTALGELFELLESLPGGDPALGRSLLNLARSAAEYVDSTAEPGVLHRTLRVLDASVRTLDPADPDRDVALAGFGAILRRHYLHGAAPAVLDTAVSAGETAARSCAEPPTASPHRHGAVLNSLVTTLITRFEYAEAPEDLDRATQIAEEAATMATDGAGEGADTGIEVSRRTALVQLGSLAHHRYRLSRQQDDLNKAVEHYERALAVMPAHAEGRAAVAANLGRALRALYQNTGRRRTYRAARRILREASELPTAPIDQRLRAASLCGRLAAQAHRWAEALESLGSAVEMLPLVAQSARSNVRARHRWAAITADAAACAVESGEPERAVELLEHGNGALLMHAVPARGDFAELRRRRPELAGELDRLRRMLDAAPGEPVLRGAADEGDARRERLAEAWAATTRQVRAESGLRNFLHVPRFAELREVGDGGPVVLVNLSRYRSDALVIIAGRVLVVPLPAARPDVAAEHSARVVAAVEGEASEEGRGTADRADDIGDTVADGAADVVRESLDWLWQHIARPVLDTLGYAHTPAEGQRWPRLWWCPSGVLEFLPLHAAAAAASVPGDEQCVLERVVASYTPALRVLARARHRDPVPAGHRGLVVSGRDGGERAVAPHWPAATVLPVGGAGRLEVLNALPRHPWVHIGDVGSQQLEDPAAARVLDRGEGPNSAGSLTVTDVALAPLEHAEFAYLARCATRAGGAPSGASMSLGGVLAAIGYAHVIATLWSVDPGNATRTCAEVYAALGTGERFDAGASAQAVHRAGLLVRAEQPADPSAWAAHVHIGP